MTGRSECCIRVTKRGIWVKSDQWSDPDWYQIKRSLLHKQTGR